MNQLVSRVYIILSLLVLMASSASAEEQIGVQKLEKKLAGISSFSADFHQTVKDQSGELLQEFKGDIKIKKPGKLYWQSYEPLAQTVVTNNEELWYYDADLEQVTIQPFGKERHYTPAMILGGQVDQLAAHYAVSVIKEEGSHVIFKLIPLEKESLFETLLLSFEDNIATQLVMTDSLQQITTIVFSKRIINTTLDDSLFQFIPPPGTEILQND